MSGDKLDSLNRRNVLKGMAAGSVLGGVPATVSASDEEYGWWECTDWQYIDSVCWTDRSSTEVEDGEWTEYKCMNSHYQYKRDCWHVYDFKDELGASEEYGSTGNVTNTTSTAMVIWEDTVATSRFRVGVAGSAYVEDEDGDEHHGIDAVEFQYSWDDDAIDGHLDPDPEDADPRGISPGDGNEEDIGAWGLMVASAAALKIMFTPPGWVITAGGIAWTLATASVDDDEDDGFRRMYLPVGDDFNYPAQVHYWEPFDVYLDPGESLEVDAHDIVYGQSALDTADADVGYTMEFSRDSSGNPDFEMYESW